MSDNPRMPGHPSDMNSSRSSETSGGSGSNNNNNPAPTSYQPTPNPAPNNHARNIILGAIVTVISSTLIYYLTVFQNKSKSDGTNHLEVKEATIEAWKSYKAYENTYAGNLLSFENTLKENGSLDIYSKGLNDESKKFLADLTDLSKTSNIDKDLVKAFKRRISNEESFMEKVNEYYNNIKKILAASANPKQKKETFVAEEIRWSQYSRGTFERSINDIQEIAKLLSERYGQPFAMTDFITVQVQPQRQKTNDSIINVLKNIDIDSNGNIVQTNFATNLSKKDVEGNWNVDGDVVSLQKNGRFVWTMADGSKAAGSWSITGDAIKIEAIAIGASKNPTQTYRVSNLTPSSFTMSQSEAPFEQYNVTRISVN